MNDEFSKKCGSCGSDRLLPGTPSRAAQGCVSFKPKDKFTVYGYGMHAFLCVDCGFIASYLRDDFDRQELVKVYEKKHGG